MRLARAETLRVANFRADVSARLHPPIMSCRPEFLRKEARVQRSSRIEDVTFIR